MELSASFLNEFIHADEYEAIGLCYQEILGCIPGVNIGFIAREIDSVYSADRQSDMACFKILDKDLLLAVQGLQEEEGEGRDFYSLNKVLLSKLNRFECPMDKDGDTPSSGKENIYKAVGIFLLMKALDKYVKLTLAYTEKEYREFALPSPLNEGSSRATCLVYLREQESFLSKAYAERKKDENVSDKEDESDRANETDAPSRLSRADTVEEKVEQRQKGATDKKADPSFRKALTASHLGDMFESFQIIDTGRLGQFAHFSPYIQSAPVPRIKRIRLGHESLRTIEGGHLRIASIHFIGFETFHFHELGKDKPCSFNEVPKGPFYIEYPEEDDESNAQQLIDLIRLAVVQKANIIVLPEFIMSPRMREKVAEYLSTTASQVVLVFAGTTYEWDNSTQTGNNVLHVLSGEGKDLGTYYKYSPFLVSTQRGLHQSVAAVPEDVDSAPEIFFENMELLSNPGAVCTLFDVEKIGRVLPAICRDVVDGEYTSGLIHIFTPSMLLIPAWSRSVASFDTYLKHYANTTHTASLLCNCCAAVGFPDYSDDKERPIGRFCLPAKRASVMDAVPKSITRGYGCRKKCHDHGGCVWLIDVDFSSKPPTASEPKMLQPR